MQISLSDKFKTQPTIIVFSALSILFMAASLLLIGELMLPLAVATMAIVFVLENGKRRIFSIVIPAVAIAADVIIHGTFSYLAFEAAILAVIIAMFFLRGSKAECSFWLTLTVFIFSLFSMALLAYSETNTFDVDAFIDYYIGLYKTVEALMLAAFEEAMATAGTGIDGISGIDSSLIPTLLSRIASLIPSIIIVCGFVIGGVSLKIFSAILRLICDEESRVRISDWRFALPKTMYVAFWVSAALNLIAGLLGDSGMFSIVVSNVYNVLLYVFVYVGLGVVVSFLTALFKKRSRAIFAMVAAFILLGALAIELIAYFGASFVFVRRRDRGDKNL